MNTEYNPIGGFIGHSTMERERCELITVEDTKRSEGVGIMNAATILGTPPVDKRKKIRKISWRGGEMDTYAIRIGEISVKEIERATMELSTKAGFYTVASPAVDIPSTVEKEIKIYLTEEEILDSIKGKYFENIAPKVNIDAAKAEIVKAIEEIAEKEHVELRNEDTEELANLSIMLLKKISEGI
jgi:hypothetical protein